MFAYLDLSTLLLYCIIAFLLFYLINNLDSIFNGLFPSKACKLPKSFPLVGMSFSLLKNIHQFSDWSANIVNSQPSSTFILHWVLGQRQIITSNPANVQHILKTNFHIYQKGTFGSRTMYDFLGHGIFNVDGDSWKFQRQLSSHEFNTKSLRKFVGTVVDTELSNRLVPILDKAAKKKEILDFQDILQRFAFDNICDIAFGYDPEYLLPSLPEAKFAVAFEDATTLISKRFRHIIPLVWKLQRFFDIGPEKELRKSIEQVRDFARKVMMEKREELQEKSELQSVDLLSRFLSSGHSDEVFVTDIVISFILAGRDTTSAALTWFFYLIANHPNVENEILAEINDKKFEKTSESSVYDEVKDMIYTHAALCESMRLYPPVPTDGKQAMEDDVLPDGTHVKKGDRVLYHPYAMGRSEKIWGSDWPVFRPERWLERDSVTGKWCFVGRDQYSYPVFQAGPRVCLGKEMAFLQMKRVVSGVLPMFRVIPVIEKGKKPVFVSYLTSKMHGGFPVRIQERDL
ncbi:Cytochrome P450-dependent fatty acid hydroxylase [Heracleum sosnowskyi]|uniref:Cytochrome P450-dependent fatty acid hydroxylase n=1 Tax=Heracleum sosnowskyi TaxID=360622 RepID=A0AAD8J930_9APIA|nr:Cytochrome P450-dependent fatty acid hydroxylase [Heracleum sosnowskyi]